MIKYFDYVLMIEVYMFVETYVFISLVLLYLIDISLLFSCFDTWMLEMLLYVLLLLLLIERVDYVYLNIVIKLLFINFEN